MYWRLWGAVLLLAWFNLPYEVQAARKKNLEVLQLWKPQSQQILHSGRQSDYPSYVQNTLTRSGYNRRRQLKSRGKAASTTTTERPFIRVWNNLVRSVQPNFGFRNLSIPFVNLFNNGNANIIETVPLQAQLYSDDNEDEQDQSSSGATMQSSNKRKRKRRKQQRRRPIYESVEQDDPYDFYGAPLRQQQKPIYYYGPNVDSYYDMRRLQAYNDYANQANYYEQYYEDGQSEEEQPEYASEENLGKKYAVLRPLGLAIKVSSSDSPAAIEIDEETDESLLANDAANENVDAPEVVDDSSSMQDDSTSTLSESMRNVIGTYMRDDQRNRQRQRQSEKKVEAISSAKTKPRNRHSFLLAARLVNAANKHQ
ncbi:uncharacterized protein LOC117791975 [Drosophila innubila]|uniref:uncharacterized protein LOC117791975 n=1 Tax=Drosophila innubila TaxID=198719 RepID=UPI00148B7AE7|nr:uncharacterized protein LOC117791975 [Drosophila innubila]